MAVSLLTIDETLSVLRISRRTLLRLRATGRLPVVKVTPGRPLFREDDVRKLIDESIVD